MTKPELDDVESVWQNNVRSPPQQMLRLVRRNLGNGQTRLPWKHVAMEHRFPWKRVNDTCETVVKMCAQ